MSRKLSGTIVSDKMQKTRVVEVELGQFNRKYQKHYKEHRRFKVHDEKNQYHLGDKVIIQETRPLSKDKRWVIIAKS